MEVVMGRRFPSLLALLKEDDRSANAPAHGQAAPVATVDPLVPAQPVTIENLSLDRKVDRYLIRYERESIPQSAVYESLVRLVLEAPEDPPPDEEEEEEDPAAATAPTEGDLGSPPGEGPPDPLGGGGMGDLSLGGEDDALGGEDPLGGGGGGGFGGGGFGGGGGFDLGGDTGEEGGGGGKGGLKPPPEINTPQINIESFAAGVARLVSNYEVLLDPKTTILNRAKAYIHSNYNESTSKYLMLVLAQNYGLVPQDAQKSPAQDPVAVGGSAMIMTNVP